MVDIDEGGDKAVDHVAEVLGQPLGVVRTRSGGHHLWYRSAEAVVGNAKWSVNGAAGDIRGSKGFVVLWDPAGTLELLEAKGEPVALDALLGKREFVPATTNGAPDIDESKYLQRFRTAKPGHRNEDLYFCALSDMERAQFDEPAYRDAALALGLNDFEIEKSIRSARKKLAEDADKLPSRDSKGLARALQLLEVDVYYDLRANRPVWSREGAPRDHSDRFESRLVEEIADRFKFDLATQRIVSELHSGAIPLEEDQPCEATDRTVRVRLRPGAIHPSGSIHFFSCRHTIVHLSDPKGGRPASVARMPTYREEFPSERDVASYRHGMRFLGAALENEVDTYRETPKLFPTLAFDASAYDAAGRLWVGTRATPDRSFVPTVVIMRPSR